MCCASPAGRGGVLTALLVIIERVVQARRSRSTRKVSRMDLIERAYIRLTRQLPGRVATRMDLMRVASLAGAPLNGQVKRQEIIRELVMAVDFEQAVETGTFRAASTMFLSHVTGRPVYSVELLTRYFGFARARCSEDSNIHLSLGDSRTFLQHLSDRISGGTTFFYLDAHWGADVPRFEELEIISGAWEHAVVMIDDFAVPDDPGYGCANYGGQDLNVDYLPDLPGWARFFPSAPSSEETGARRGCVVLASPSLIEYAGKVRSLRRADGPQADV
jgi:hypothetical protein